ncbi:MAG: 6,7-dimethyl-8-ribityllumazine synthase [Planctomycetota bacterium]
MDEIKAPPERLAEADTATDGDMRFAVVAARWNEAVISKLLAGAETAFADLGIPGDRVETFRVPGSFELPVACAAAARAGRFDGVVGLGVVIKGDTEHDRYINASVAEAFQQISVETGVPVLFGVLTVNDEAQALARAGGSHGNKGDEAVRAAVETVATLRAIGGG